MSNRRLVFAAIVLSLMQIGFLSWFIVARAAVLRDGREIVLKVEPVDPRDLFRGDYVRLGYAISRLPVTLVEGRDTQANVPEGTRVTVRLRAGEDGFWTPSAVAFNGPLAMPGGEGDVDIIGRSDYAQNLADGSTLAVSYGIERFYLPEGQGRPIEARLRESAFAVVAAVDDDGTPQIKALTEGGERLFEEPLY